MVGGMEGHREFAVGYEVEQFVGENNFGVGIEFTDTSSRVVGKRVPVGVGVKLCVAFFKFGSYFFISFF